MRQLKRIGVPLTKAELRAMRLPCPFCGQELKYIEDDDAGYDEGYHQREFVFEHTRDHDEHWHGKSGCGCQLAYFFNEDTEDTDKEHVEEW